MCMYVYVAYLFVLWCGLDPSKSVCLCCSCLCSCGIVGALYMNGPLIHLITLKTFLCVLLSIPAPSWDAHPSKGLCAYVVIDVWSLRPGQLHSQLGVSEISMGINGNLLRAFSPSLRLYIYTYVCVCTARVRYSIVLVCVYVWLSGCFVDINLNMI